MKTYTVVKPMRGSDGKTLAAGQSIDLTDRQAKWLLLSGKIARIQSEANAKNKTAKSKPADKKEE